MRQHIKFIAAVTCILISIDVYAKNKTPVEKLYITADTTNYNYKTGVNTFTGHVKAHQGAHYLTADTLVTKQEKNHALAEVIAYGFKQQAHYWTISKNNEPAVEAYADVIKLYPAEENVVMENNVTITQGENSFQGQRVIYNKTDQTITVPQSKNGRATLIYQPENES